MRICNLADGMEVQTLRWAKYFADREHEVHLIAYPPFGDNTIEDVKLHALKRFRPHI